MSDNIQNYLSSGILEAYVIGSLTEQEEQEVVQMKKKYPAINEALFQLEEDMERLAMQMAIPPPPELWNKIEGDINSLINTQEAEVVPFTRKKENSNNFTSKPDQQFIEVEAQSNYMKVHKLWRWVFAAVFLLGKIFLATAIYFYIEYRHNQQEIKELKMQVQQTRQLKQ